MNNKEEEELNLVKFNNTVHIYILMFIISRFFTKYELIF